MKAPTNQSDSSSLELQWLVQLQALPSHHQLATYLEMQMTLLASTYQDRTSTSLRTSMLHATLKRLRFRRGTVHSREKYRINLGSLQHNEPPMNQSWRSYVMKIVLSTDNYLTSELH